MLQKHPQSMLKIHSCIEEIVSNEFMFAWICCQEFIQWLIINEKLFFSINPLKSYLVAL